MPTVDYFLIKRINYINVNLGSNRQNFYKFSIRGIRVSTYHQMILSEIRGVEKGGISDTAEEEPSVPLHPQRGSQCAKRTWI